MVQRYVALAYDKGRVQRADDLPQPLLWPQLRVSDEEIAETTSAFNLTDSRPIVGFCPGAEFGPAKRWPHYHYAALAQRLIESGYQIALFGSAKTMRPANRSAPRCRTTRAISALIWPEKPSWSRR